MLWAEVSSWPNATFALQWIQTMTPIFFDNMKPHSWAAMEKVSSLLNSASTALVIAVKSSSAADKLLEKVSKG